MQEPPIITLTSDFGSRDGYVAAVKGVVLGIHPDARLIDISYDLLPHDVPHTTFVLGTACQYFPPRAVHVAVVDPGVGTARSPLLLVTPEGRYICPDNGLLTYVVMGYALDRRGQAARPPAEDAFMKPRRAPVPRGCSAYVLNREEYWLRPVSNTFHGRDIFAPVAAHLSLGVPADELGEAVDDMVCLAVPSPTMEGDTIQGHVVHIDRFGNLISNVRIDVAPHGSVSVEVLGSRIHGVSRSYVEARGLLAIVGSHGYLEVSLANGSAAGHLGARVGARVSARLRG